MGAAGGHNVVYCSKTLVARTWTILKKVCRELRHVMGSFERPNFKKSRRSIRSCASELHERDSFFDRQNRHFGRLLEPAKSEIVSFARDATLGSTDIAKRLDVTSKSKRKAATLGRTTDLRIIAETAIPRSTTELQQLIQGFSSSQYTSYRFMLLFRPRIVVHPVMLMCNQRQ